MYLPFLEFFLIGCAMTVRARLKPTLHAAVLETSDFVAIGAANEGWAGLHRHRQGTNWVCLGWKNTRNFGLDVAPADPETIFLACGNGVLRTQDGGHSWRVTTDWQITEVLDVAVDPNVPQHVYIATAYGVWRSPDHGETWQAMSHGIPEPQATFTPAIAVDRRRAGHLVVGSEEGLFRTTNGGMEWTPVGPRAAAIRDVVQSAAAPDLWLAGTENQGVLASRDGGATWQCIASHADLGTLYAVAADPTNPDRMAAAGLQGGVYLSTDGGNRWRGIGLEEQSVHALIFDANDPDRLWAGTLGSGIFYTDDQGALWHDGGLPNAVIWNMDFFNLATTNEDAADVE